MLKDLKLTPFEATSAPISVNLSVPNETSNQILIEFSIPLESVNANTTFSYNHSNWALWEFDVFEVFFQRRLYPEETTSSYFEFQISPLGQYFQLEVFRPRKHFWTPLNHPVSYSSHYQNKIWSAALRINWPHPLVEFYFNLHAILGENHQRKFYSLNDNFQQAPDFHLPKYFVSIFD